MNKNTVAILIITTVLSYLFSHNSLPILVYMYIIIWIVVWKVLALKQAMLYYLTVLLIEGDISKMGASPDIPFSSIYTEYIFGKSIFVIWTSLIFFILLFYYINYKSLKINKKLLPIFIVFLTSILVSFSNDKFEIKYFISDLAYFINFFTGYMIVILFFKNFKDLKYFFMILVTVSITKALIVSIDGYFMSLSSFFNTIAAESGAYLYPIVLIYSFLMVSHNKSSSIFSISSIMIFMMITASRGRIAIALLSLFLSSYLTKNFKSIFIFIFIFIFMFMLISFWNEDVKNYFLWKVGSFVPTEASGGEAKSSAVRIVEFLNIFYMHLNDMSSFLFGKGLGGYFTSEYVSYPFNLYNEDSYPDEWISNDTFYKPHGSSLYMLLKFGVFGTLFIFITVIRLSMSIAKKAYISKKNYEYNYMLIAIASSLPFLFLVNFTSKLQVFSGIFFAILVNTNFKKVYK